MLCAWFVLDYDSDVVEQPPDVSWQAIQHTSDQNLERLVRPISQWADCDTSPRKTAMLRAAAPDRHVPYQRP